MGSSGPTPKPDAADPAAAPAATPAAATAAAGAPPAAAAAGATPAAQPAPSAPDTVSSITASPGLDLKHDAKKDDVKETAEKKGKDQTKESQDEKKDEKKADPMDTLKSTVDQMHSNLLHFANRAKQFSSKQRGSFLPENQFSYRPSSVDPHGSLFGERFKEFDDSMKGIKFDDPKAKDSFDAQCLRVDRALDRAFKKMVTGEFNSEAKDTFNKRLESAKKELVALTKDMPEAKKAVEEKMAKLESALPEQLKKLNEKLTEQKNRDFEKLVGIAAGRLSSWIDVQSPSRQPINGPGAATGDLLGPNMEGSFNKDGTSRFNVNVSKGNVTISPSAKSFWQDFLDFTSSFKFWEAPRNFKEGWSNAFDFLIDNLKTTRITFDFPGIKDPSQLHTGRLDAILELAKEKKVALTWGPSIMAVLRLMPSDVASKYMNAATRTQLFLEEINRGQLPRLNESEHQTKMSAMGVDLESLKKDAKKLEGKELKPDDVKKAYDSASEKLAKESVAKDDAKAKASDDLMKSAATVTPEAAHSEGLKLAAKSVSDRIASIQTELKTRLDNLEKAREKLKTHSDTLKEDYHRDVPAQYLEKREEELKKFDGAIQAEYKALEARVAEFRTELGELHKTFDGDNLGPKKGDPTDEKVRGEIFQKLEDTINPPDSKDTLLGKFKKDIDNSKNETDELKTKLDKSRDEAKKESEAETKAEAEAHKKKSP